MKKMFLSIMLCIVTVILISCSVPYKFSQSLSDLNNIQIEIVNLETDMGQHPTKPYNEEHVSVIKVIENDKKEDFLSDFKKIKCYKPIYGSRIDKISGKAIRITYPDGEIELITDSGTATVKNSEIFVQTTQFDSDDFADWINKYS